MSIVDLIFPKICVGCGMEGEYICCRCREKMQKPEQICPMCGKASLEGWVHPRCRKKNGIERLMIGLSYSGVVQGCLKKVKYKSSWEIVEYLFNLTDFGQMIDFVVVDVPMWRGKERERGFNQAQVLAKLFSVRYKVPNISALVRVRPTLPMFGLSKSERKDNIESAFGVIKDAETMLTGGKVVLIDDVWTTGATMRECARILKQVGVREVCALALAK